MLRHYSMTPFVSLLLPEGLGLLFLLGFLTVVRLAIPLVVTDSLF